MDRQYVGARYIVKVYENSQDIASAEWEANVNYESMTMVTYNYGTYVSKKPVPASVGNPAENGGYWVQTGFYNGQIAQLQNQIAQINTELVEVRKKKYIFCGDSYSSNTEAWGTGWIDKVVAKLGLTANVDAFDARGLATYYGGSFASGDFATQLEEIYDAYTSVADEITDICCFGGTNEVVYTSEQIEAGIESFCEYAREHFPNAQIHIGFVGGSRDTTNWTDFLRALNVYRNCGKYGAGYVTNIEYVNTDYDHFTVDGLHPTDMSKLAEYITSGIINGSVDYHSTYTLINNGTTMIINFKNGVVTFALALPSTLPVTVNQGFIGVPSSMTEIADFGVLPVVRLTHSFNTMVAVNPSNQGWDTQAVIWSIAPSGKLYLAFNNYGHQYGGSVASGSAFSWNSVEGFTANWDI